MFPYILEYNLNNNNYLLGGKHMLELAAILKEHGLKVTPQRLSIFRMLRQTKMHPSAETIYQSLQEEHPTMSLATVYKTLDTFVSHGLIQQLNLGEDSYRYDADTSSHMHFKCNKCGKLYDLKQPDFSMLTGTEDFEIKQVHLYCWGLCPDCKSENTSVNEDFNNYKQ